MTALGSQPNPVRLSMWIRVLLIVSLSANLLIAAAAVTRYFVAEPPGRASGVSHQQIIPRKFFAELDKARRKELMAVFKDFRADVKAGREEARSTAAVLALALESEPYDEERVKSAIATFTDGATALMEKGGGIAVDFIARLTPEERIILAGLIRQRAEQGKTKK